MPVTNLLKQQVDQPVYEWMRFAPFSNSTTTPAGILTAGENGIASRYIYYIYSSLSTSTFRVARYDTYSDSWSHGAELNFSASSGGAAQSAKFTNYNGFRGDVISASSNTLLISC